VWGLTVNRADQEVYPFPVADAGAGFMPWALHLRQYMDYLMCLIKKKIVRIFPVVYC